MIKLKDFSIKIKISSNSFDTLVNYISLLKPQLTQLSIPFTIIRLPKSKFKFTLFRSPHVHKKSKEHYALYKYTIVIYLKCNFKLLKYIQFNLLKNDVKVNIFKI